MMMGRHLSESAYNSIQVPFFDHSENILKKEITLYSKTQINWDPTETDHRSPTNIGQVGDDHIVLIAFTLNDLMCGTPTAIRSAPSCEDFLSLPLGYLLLWLRTLPLQVPEIGERHWERSPEHYGNCCTIERDKTCSAERQQRVKEPRSGKFTWVTCAVSFLSLALFVE